MTSTYFCSGLSDSPILQDLNKRLDKLKGKDKSALESELKEWIAEKDESPNEIWSIPDLTNITLRAFFLRAIERIN